MGAVSDRCSDMNPAERHASFRKNSHGRGMAKALDEDSSEDGEEEEEDLDEMSDRKGSDAEEMRAETELVLREGLTKSSAATFHEVIDHAKGLGIDPAKISKAEQMLEQHRAQQRRELFEADMKEFLVTAEADNLDACKERLDQGRGYGCSEKVLQPLRARIADLELCIDLAVDEVAKAKLFLELCTRSFVRSCVAGRDTIWVDLTANKRMKAVLHLDVVLKNFTMKSSKGEQLATAKVVGLEVKRALEVERISSTEAFGKLPEKEKQFGVVFVGEQVTWLIGENNRASQDEFLVGLAVLNRKGIEVAVSTWAKEKGKSNATFKKPAVRSGSPLEDVTFAAEDGEAPASPRSKSKATSKMSKVQRSGSVLAAEDGEEENAIENNEPQDNEQEDIGFQEVEDNSAAAPWHSEEEPPKSASSQKEVPEAAPAAVAAQEKDKKEKKEKKEKKDKKHKKESK